MKNAWIQLKATITGAQRALWVAKTTKPVNWQNATVAPPATLQFPGAS